MTKAWQLGVVVAAVLGVLGGAPPAAAQPATPVPAAPRGALVPVEGAGATARTSRFEDWLLRCGALEDGRGMCEIAQGITAAGRGLVAQIVLGRAGKDDPLRLIVQLPEGVFLPAGVSVALDGTAPAIPLAYQRCVKGCFAEAELTPALVEALKAARGPGTITFADGARRPTVLPVSFNGFVPALEASLKP